MVKNGDIRTRSNSTKWLPGAREQMPQNASVWNAAKWRGVRESKCCEMAAVGERANATKRVRVNAAKWKAMPVSKCCEMAAVCERARPGGMLQNGEVCARGNAAKWRGVRESNCCEKAAVGESAHPAAKMARCVGEQMLRTAANRGEPWRFVQTVAVRTAPWGHGSVCGANRTVALVHGSVCG